MQYFSASKFPFYRIIDMEIIYGYKWILAKIISLLS